MNEIIYFLIIIVILIFVHEFGHFAAARLSKMRVDVFSIGFGQRLFGYNKLTGFTFGSLPKDFDLQGNTDYRLCLLPLGGYAKIAGMVDESFDTKFADKKPEPYEFRAKPLLSKLFVITAGVMMNFTLAVAIFWGINFFQGKQTQDSTVIGAVKDSTVTTEFGFKRNDEIISINDTPVNSWNGVINNLLINKMGKTINVAIKRDGKDTTLILPGGKLLDSAKTGMLIFAGPIYPVIDSVVQSSPAERAGFKKDDVLLGLNNTQVISSNDIKSIVALNKGKEITATILRNEKELELKVNIDTASYLGVYPNPTYFGEYTYYTFGFFEAIVEGINDSFGQVTLFFKIVYKIITGEVAFGQVFGGPVKIAQFAAKSAETGFVAFIFLLASLSLTLGVVNILPIPVMDGGHVVIITIEGILRRELPIKAKIAIQNVGFILILALMAFIIYNDIITF